MAVAATGRRGLSLARLGLALAGLTAAAWLTGLPYLLVRFGLPTPLPLARVDGPHIFVGLAMGGLLAAKAIEIRRRPRLRLPGIRLWQRWISLGLLVLYGAVFASGLLLLPHWPAPLRRDLVNLHLLTAFWAAAATLPHVLGHLRWGLPRGLVDRRFAATAAVLLLTGLAFAMVPAAAAPLTQLGAGGAWAPVGPANSPAFRLIRLPDGRLLSAGAGLWLSSDQGRAWTRLPAPAGEFLLAVATGSGGSPVYVGSTAGLFRAAAVEGPYLPVRSPAGVVDSIFADPESGLLWIGGHGVWRSADGGASWAAAGQGVIPQGSIWAFAHQQSRFYLAGSTGVYQLVGAAWQRSLELPEVVSLDAGDGGSLWASSMGGGLAELEGGRWVRSNAGLRPHGKGAIHITTFLAEAGGRAFAGSMDGGVSESVDGGASWAPFSPRFDPGAVWRILPVPDGLLAATAIGLFHYSFPTSPAPGAPWWSALLLVALVLPGFAIAGRPARTPSSRPEQVISPAAGARFDAGRRSPAGSGLVQSNNAAAPHER